MFRDISDPQFEDMASPFCSDNMEKDTITQMYNLLVYLGPRGGAVVEALRYKPEGRGIDSRWCH
jgi:hypothetical protein